MSDLAHLEPITYVLRLYAQGDSFDQDSPYIASAMIQVMGTVAFVSGLSGTLSRKHYRAFMARLHEEGITEMMAQRRGSLKCVRVPSDRGRHD